MKRYSFYFVLFFVCILPSCGPGIRKVDVISISDPSFEKGQNEYLKERYRNAERLFREYLIKTDDPLKMASAEYWLGMTVMRQGEYPQALEIFSRINKRHTSSRLWNLIQKAAADTCFFMKDYSAAAARFEKIEQRTSDGLNRAEILFKKGICRVRTSDFYMGKRTLSRVVSEYPNTFYAERAAETLQECDGYFFVQIGAFTQRDSAETVMRKAADKGFTAYIRVMSVGNRRMYSVRVGRLNDYGAAESFAEMLRKNGFMTVVKP